MQNLSAIKSHLRALAGAILYGDPEATLDAIRRAGGIPAQALESDSDAAAVFQFCAREANAKRPITAAGIMRGAGLSAAVWNALADEADPYQVPQNVATIREWIARQKGIEALERQDADLSFAWLEARRIVEPILEAARGDPLAELRSLADLAAEEIETGEILVGDNDCRMIERCAVVMLSGASGTGKSHVAGQLATGWAQGVTVFGLPPVAPLRCLLLQAENPPNDARAIAKSMLRGVGGNGKSLVAENTRQLWLPGCTGDDFLARADAVLSKWPADMVFIDPLLAFAPGDLTKPDVVQSFCRTGLNTLAAQHRCALFVLHHQPKPNQSRDPSRMTAYDFQYMASGNADLAANWPRCVLTLQPLARGEFLLRAAKRRPPWKNSDGEQAWEIGLRHTERGVWETFEADPEAVRTGRPPAPEPETYATRGREIAATVCPCTKGTLVGHLQRLTGARNRARELVDHLVISGVLDMTTGTGRGAPVIIRMADKKGAA